MELVAERSNFITERAPTGAPARYGLVNLVELAEFADWPAVSRNAHGLFETAETLKADSPLKAEIARIAAATPDPVRRAELALALVQEQVRYLFIGMNDGGFVPAPADLTWQRRFGDCKARPRCWWRCSRGWASRRGRSSSIPTAAMPWRGACRR
jgi:hypothetical protein